MAKSTVENVLRTLRAEVSQDEEYKCQKWFLEAFKEYTYRFANQPETTRIVLSCYTVTELDRTLKKTKLPVGWRTRQHVSVENLALFFHETILEVGFDKLTIQAQMKKLSEQSKRDKRGYERYFDAFPNLQVEEEWLKAENAVKV